MRRDSGGISVTDYDYIIVGAGSAGCVLANRLSADGATVLVVEAGGADWDPLIHIPIGIGLMHNWRSHDWGYDTEAEPGLGGRSIEAMRGKVVGGSSSINHLGFVRGNRGDYDRWAAAGLDGWSYRNVLPYFRRYETWEEGPNTYRGGDGPLHVIRGRSTDPLFDSYIAAAQETGIPFTEDQNGANQVGIARGQSTIHRGRRQSAATSFLRPALARSNVTLLANTHVTRLLMEGVRATGVEYRRKGAVGEARARRDVILSGGVFNTPQLLMLSGIGPADALKDHGIAPVVDSPGVGRNLQDHIGVIVTAKRLVPGPFVRELRFDRMTVNMIRAQLFGSGPATVLPGGVHGYVKSDASLTVPDLQLIFQGVSNRAHLWFPGLRKPAPDRCGVRPIVLHPVSRGRVELASADPFAKVRIYQNFFAAEADMKTLLGGVRIGREILGAAAMAAHRGEEASPGADRKTDAEIAEWIRATALTAHHPCGTATMGVGPEAVLDSEMKVRGAENLRVVDASAMPDLVSGNINACVLMMAEKASDMILGRPPLPAADV
jgi:choline dehydrogenase-like flavoprotein